MRSLVVLLLLLSRGAWQKSPALRALLPRGELSYERIERALVRKGMLSSGCPSAMSRLAGS